MKALSNLKSRMKDSSCAWTWRFVSSDWLYVELKRRAEKTDWRSIAKNKNGSAGSLVQVERRKTSILCQISERGNNMVGWLVEEGLLKTSIEKRKTRRDRVKI